MPVPESGTFANGMEYARWGTGPKTVLWIPGGPGSDVPHGTFAALSGAQFRPLLEAGYSVWQVTRRRNMPQGHSVQDMADDYARLIADTFGGAVDLVVGVSYGGMIVQYLAADHPERLGKAVIALAASEVTTWGHDVDRRWAQARAEGRSREAGEAMAEYIYPEPRHWRRRKVVGAVLATAFKDEEVPAGDLRVESDAEVLFDATEALPRITVPTLVISAQEDLFFDPEVVARTVEAIPGATAIEYEGMGHIKAAMSSRLVQDVLEFAEA
jgi:pimeloyl-ACP methyl ester carboxylesterase